MSFRISVSGSREMRFCWNNSARNKMHQLNYLGTAMREGIEIERVQPNQFRRQRQMYDCDDNKEVLIQRSRRVR